MLKGVYTMNIPGLVIEEGYDRGLAKLSVGKGWHGLIDILFDAKPDDVVVVQVKEKFGGLRFYVGGATEQYHDLIGVAEWMSECLCENCGKVGQVIRLGWWKTRCPECEGK